MKEQLKEHLKEQLKEHLKEQLKEHLATPTEQRRSDRQPRGIDPPVAHQKDSSHIPRVPRARLEQRFLSSLDNNSNNNNN
ncbi:hypothetical protein EYF80_018150 [Liparis tanakae]|uniref:Uncharacterized protein n=1 Tax=Liparis tanakae TaxID=230148 RepID=A0A4Z2I2D1_9TELE|nr:hypothetical protein EYF80_018150 [Liparis tanakae]